MTESVFSRIGPYAIRCEINQGGMATVYLAEDTRCGRQVALRRVIARDADILDAERRGAELQQLFWKQSKTVPEIFETFTAGGAFVVAMEYLAGQDLSELIAAGPVAPQRACEIATALCRFLEDAQRFQATIGGREVRHLLHGDLTPRNIRLTGAGVFILDFGISKALSVSRKVTRNDFGNIAYLSPERLESGEMDATDGFWSVGVMLYEMLRGEKPFRSADPRRLEQLIVARQAPEPLPDGCPRGLRAVAAKLLAPAVADRFGSAEAIRRDLERFAAGQPTLAEAEGWPAADEAATRRTRAADADEEATRPIARTTPPRRPSRPAQRWVVVALLVAVAIVGASLAAVTVNEVRVYRGAGRALGSVRTSRIVDLPALWRRYDALSEQSYLRVGVWRLARELTDRTETLADRVIRTYGTGVSGIRETQWEQAHGPLVRAARVDPDDRRLRAALRFIEGHLHRIDGDGNSERRQAALAQREYAEALTAFREAAELRPDWPEPFLGLARTFVAGLGDLEKGEDAIEQARRLGRTALEPEMRLLALGYRRRADQLAASAARLADTPQEEAFLARAREAYQRAIALQASLPGSGSAGAILASRRGLARVDERLEQLVDTATAPDAVNTGATAVHLGPQ